MVDPRGATWPSNPDPHSFVCVLLHFDRHLQCNGKTSFNIQWWTQKRQYIFTQCNYGIGLWLTGGTSSLRWALNCSLNCRRSTESASSGKENYKCMLKCKTISSKPWKTGDGWDRNIHNQTFNQGENPDPDSRPSWHKFELTLGVQEPRGVPHPVVWTVNEIWETAWLDPCYLR